MAIGGVVVVALAGIAYFVTSRPSEACDDTRRAALLSIPPFGGQEAPISDLMSEDSSEPIGCTMTFVVNARADPVARYYADRLDEAGWTGLGTGVERIHDDPYTLLVAKDNDGGTDRAWKDFHYFVSVTRLGSQQVRVEVAVRHYVSRIF